MIIKSIIKNFLLNIYVIDTLNFIINKLLKVKKILDSSYKGIGKFIYIKESDIFIVSYPKSGNTWMRLIVANMFFKDVNINNIDKFSPEYYSQKESLFFNNKKRIFKSHDYFDHRFKKVIYIVRDPREVLVSSYYFQIKLGSIVKNYSKRKFFKDFLKGKFDSNFGSWQENVGSWYGAKNGNILFIKYENLIDHPYKEISKLSKFLNLKLTKKKLNQIINKTSMQNFKKLEKTHGLNWNSLKDSNKKMNFFRSGKKNTWRKFLTNKEKLLIKSKWFKMMKVFGYE